MNKGVKTMSGLSIAGICIAVMGVLVAIWGASIFHGKLLSPDFMTFAVSGVVMLAIGLCMIAGLTPIVKIGSIWLATVMIIAYIVIMPDIDRVVVLISAVPAIGLAVWLTMRLLK